MVVCRDRGADDGRDRSILRPSGVAAQGSLSRDRHPLPARRSSSSSSVAGPLSEGKGFIDVSRLELFGWEIKRATFEFQWYWVLLVLAVIAVLAARNLFRIGLGRSFMAVRDHDIAAEAIGVNLTRTKVTAFAVSSGFVGLAGASPRTYTETVIRERFTLDVSVLYLAMIIVGGLGLDRRLRLRRGLHDSPACPAHEASDASRGRLPFLAEQLPAIKNAVFGLVIVLFLIIEPRGLARIWQRTGRLMCGSWPFRY